MKKKLLPLSLKFMKMISKNIRQFYDDHQPGVRNC